jgi:hypothetical protein
MYHKNVNTFSFWRAIPKGRYLLCWVMSVVGPLHRTDDQLTLGVTSEGSTGLLLRSLAGTQKWYYSIMCQCNETETAGFEASRKSTNDGLAHEGAGDLEANCASLQEAQAAVAAWHQYRYGDNDVEFAE